MWHNTSLKLLLFPLNRDMWRVNLVSIYFQKDLTHKKQVLIVQRINNLQPNTDHQGIFKQLISKMYSVLIM